MPQSLFCKLWQDIQIPCGKGCNPDNSQNRCAKTKFLHKYISERKKRQKAKKHLQPKIPAYCREKTVQRHKKPANENVGEHHVGIWVAVYARNHHFHDEIIRNLIFYTAKKKKRMHNSRTACAAAKTKNNFFLPKCSCGKWSEQIDRPELLRICCTSLVTSIGDYRTSGGRCRIFVVILMLFSPLMMVSHHSRLSRYHWMVFLMPSSNLVSAASPTRYESWSGRWHTSAYRGPPNDRQHA